MSVVPLNKKHWPQTIRNLQNARDVALVEVSLQMWCIMQHESRPITETVALKLGNFANKVTSIVCRGSTFVAKVKSVINFSTAFKKEHSVSFLFDRMVDTVEKSFHPTFWPAKPHKHTGDTSGWQCFSIKVPIFTILRKILTRKKSGFSMLRISCLDCGTFFSAQTEK